MAEDLSKSEIYVKILSMEKVIFEGSVYSLSSVNEAGLFDVLPLHTNFISLIKDKIVLHHKDKHDEEIKIASAVLRVSENKVHVFLDV